MLTDLDRALERQDLAAAIELAQKYARRHGQPIPLGTAAEILPLVLRESPSEYDTYALHFLGRWITERARTIDEAADLAAALAELPEKPTTELPL
jgi:hypothetical protein